MAAACVTNSISDVLNSLNSVMSSSNIIMTAVDNSDACVQHEYYCTAHLPGLDIRHHRVYCVQEITTLVLMSAQ